MAITLNNIEFNRTSNIGTGTAIALVRKTDMTESVMNNFISNISDSAQLASALGAVNALNIDWNGAQLDSQTTINTTGELLSQIASLKSDVELLKASLANLANQLNTLVTWVQS